MKTLIADYNGGRMSPEAVERLTPAEDGLPAKIVDAARSILEGVRTRGNAALIEYTERFDGTLLGAGELRVSNETIAESASKAEPELVAAIRRAIDNVRRFHDPQRPSDYTIEGAGGSELSLMWRPVSAAALYVPGGRAAYPTSVIMNAVPAQVAGVERLAALTVPGTVESNPAVACALAELGIEEVYRVAGAQSIGAVAYGTETIDPVDVIVGPGNAYVAAAKREVYGRVGIDSVAGPSEVLILADDTANPTFVAWDLLAQAEHDPMARCILATTSAALAESAVSEFERLAAESPRQEIVTAAWENHGIVLRCETNAELVELCGRMAPEHLQVILANPPAPEELVAGAIFIGNHAPTAIGDYIAGPNHVLPTGGAARFSGPLGVHVFVRPSTVVRGTPAMTAELAGPGARIADYERLAGHAGALRSRLGEVS